MDEMSADEARRNWSGLLDRAHWQGDIGISRNGKPWVVVVSREWYDAVVADIHLLRADYIVGHKDGDPLNNDPGNLEIVKRPSSDAASSATRNNGPANLEAVEVPEGER